MTQTIAFTTAVLVSVALSTVLFCVLWRPLQLILAHLCSSAEAARFWVAFTGVMLFLAPLLITALFAPEAAQPTTVAVLRAAMSASLFGAMVALLVVGWQLARPRPY
ncbi:MAG TPA: hypothetical protein VF315_09180 [Steroidobacteraceae bacterium]